MTSNDPLIDQICGREGCILRDGHFGDHERPTPVKTSGLVEEKKWYVTLGDGTYVEMDERPYVFLATKHQIDHLDSHGGDAPIAPAGCEQFESLRLIDAHIHIRELVEQSHWEDHTPVVERNTPDRINS